MAMLIPCFDRVPPTNGAGGEAPCILCTRVWPTPDVVALAESGTPEGCSRGLLAHRSAILSSSSAFAPT